MSKKESNVVALPKKLPIKPLLNFVLLEREKLSDQLDDKYKSLKNSNFIVPETTDKRNAPARGVIVAAGPDSTEDVLNSIGSTCYFASHSGRYLDPTENSPYFVVTDEDIIGIVEE